MHLFLNSAIISWLAAGGTSALAVYLLLPERVKGGTTVTVLLAICGALLGGSVASRLLSSAFSPEGSEIVASAAIGALILAFAHRILFRIAGSARRAIGNTSL